MPVHFCPRCKSLIRPGLEKCQNCGSAVSGEYETSQASLFEITEDIPAPKVIGKENSEAPYLPYEPRSTQITIINDMRNALDQGKHIVVESGTGTGKTIVSLASALEHAIPLGKKIVYLTRTISQSDQVMKELKAVSKLKPISGVPITGRGRSCPQFNSKPGYDGLSANILSSMCENLKSSHQCRYFESVKSNYSKIENYVHSNFPKSDELDSYCKSLNVCPYEAKKLLMKDCDVVAAPYVHILSEDIRSNFLRNLDADENGVVLVIDEAHNLIDAARDQESFTISIDMVNNAIDECGTFRYADAPIYEEISIRKFLENFKRIIKFIADEKIEFGKNESLLVPTTIIEDKIFESYGIGRGELSLILDKLEDVGEARNKLLMEEGESKLSNIYLLATSMKKWMLTCDDAFIRSVKTEDGEVYLQATCIDPYDVVSFIRYQKGAIHMSGTLQPLDQYVKILSLPKDTITKIYPSPFPKDNRKVLYMTNVTTRYQDMKENPAIFNVMERNIAKLCNMVQKNTLVFFTSYGLMKQMREFLERDIKKPLYWEESGKPAQTSRSLTEFRMGRNGVFCSVMGGSVAEGIDFPGEELCFAIIVGIPFPPPTLENKAMSDLFDKKFGAWTGWRYVSLAPAMRKMKQAIGRLIRTETDRGMAVIMDYRISKYAKELEAEVTNDVLKDVGEFFSHK